MNESSRFCVAAAATIRFFFNRVLGLSQCSSDSWMGEVHFSFSSLGISFGSVTGDCGRGG